MGKRLEPGKTRTHHMKTVQEPRPERHVLTGGTDTHTTDEDLAGVPSIGDFKHLSPRQKLLLAGMLSEDASGSPVTIITEGDDDPGLEGNDTGFAIQVDDLPDPSNDGVDNATSYVSEIVLTGNNSFADMVEAMADEVPELAAKITNEEELLHTVMTVFGRFVDSGHIKATLNTAFDVAFCFRGEEEAHLFVLNVVSKQFPNGTFSVVPKHRPSQA